MTQFWLNRLNTTRIESNMTQFWSDVKFGVSLYFLNFYFVRRRRHFLFIDYLSCIPVTMVMRGHLVGRNVPPLNGSTNSSQWSTVLSVPDTLNHAGKPILKKSQNRFRKFSAHLENFGVGIIYDFSF